MQKENGISRFQRLHFPTVLRGGCLIVLYVLLYSAVVANHANGVILAKEPAFLLVTAVYWGLAFLLLFRPHCRLAQKSPSSWRLVRRFLFLAVPLGAFLVEEIVYNPHFISITGSRVAMNYVIYLGLQIGIAQIFQSRRAACRTVLFFSWVFGTANHYVMLFKGNPLLPNDLMAFRTAAKVAGNYDFVLANSLVFGTLLLMLFLAAVQLLEGRRERGGHRCPIRQIFVGVVWTVTFTAAVYSLDWRSIWKITLDAWRPENTYYENGALLSFLLEVQEAAVPAPAGYSRQEASGFLDALSAKGAASGGDTAMRPSVIVIMNESFADLSMLGDLGAEECLENWNNMEHFVMRGNAYASVIGGGTCNSEFEFLTCNSMANLNGNSYPYQLFSFQDVFNLAGTFAEQGYETIAIHPENKNNWNRDRVYSEFGFERFLSLAEMEEVEYIRYYMSDRSDYDQIISAYENSRGPAFIFNITMQNHGGYEDRGLPESMELVQIGEKYEGYKDVITYLTLIRESDRAFAELLDFFSQVEEPVIICMFGDHQPALNSSFYDEIMSDLEGTALEKRQMRCCVPYIVWSNYDSGISDIVLDTSLNFLGADILELAGAGTPYTGFLREMQREIPIVNRYGYRTADGIWHSLEEPDELMDQYRKLQYYMLFDNVRN